ncbi:MAG TPA: chromate transporter, partial [Rhizomicrobium sp.]
ALIAPPGVMVFAVGRIWQRFHHRPWLRDVQAGLSAVTVGLVAAAALLLAETSAEGWRAILLVVAAAIVLTLTRIHPLLVLGVGAVLGMAGWV